MATGSRRGSRRYTPRCTTVSLVPDWTDPAWLGEAHAWVGERLVNLDGRLTGEIEQPHVRPWSTVMRVPTANGDLWFKANAPVLAYEAGVVEVLSRARPDLVPELRAVDLERGWMLMGDGGERLREIVERERDLGRWLDVLPLYGELQLDLARHQDELVSTSTSSVEHGALGIAAAALDERLLGISERIADDPRRAPTFLRRPIPLLRRDATPTPGVRSRS